MARHLLDETAEFSLPNLGRHARPHEAPLEATLRFDAGIRPSQPRPEPRPATRTS